MGELAVKQESEVSAVTDISGGLLDVIARAARDPNVDIDKMERLLQMQERVQARAAKAAYDDAMAIMQPTLPIIDERGQILNKDRKVQSTYAYWEDINEIIKPILAEHGFALTFKGRTTENRVITIGILSHREGHREETEVELPRDDSGNKNAVQAIGSSKSYGKRYAAFDLLNITTKGLDDDGQSAARPRDKLDNAIAQGSASPPIKGNDGHPDWPDGPCKNVTALKAKWKLVKADLVAAGDIDSFDIVVSDNRAVLNQVRAALPSWWTGEGLEPGQGIGEWMHNRRIELTELQNAGDGQRLAGDNGNTILDVG